MSGFDFDRVIPRRGTGCAKYDAAESAGFGPDVLPLWVADMDFQAPECVREALARAVGHGIFGYPIPTEGYYDAVCGWFARRFGWMVQREHIVQTPGVVFALAAAVRASTNPGDAVLVQPPVYYPFYRVVEQNGRKLVTSQLMYRDGKYTVDFADMEAKIRDNGVKLFIFCSPHNPTGRVWTREELVRLGRICQKHGVTVISDEIHCDFAFPEHPHTPFVLACPEMAENTIVCTAPSKTFNLAGLQVSNIIIPEDSLRERFGRELEIVSYHGVNCLGAAACQAAYEGGERWLDACKEYMRGNLDFVRGFLREELPRVRLVEPEGTYFAWLDCSGLMLPAGELDERLKRAGLWLDTGAMFGTCAADFQRVVLACPRATVRQALERLKAAVSD